MRSVRARLLYVPLVLSLILPLATLAQTKGSRAIREALQEKLRLTPEQFERLRLGESLERLRAEGDADAAGSEGPSAFGMRSTTGTETPVSADAEIDAEVHAAINPIDSTNIIVSPISSASASGSGLTCPVYYTKDFGRTWQRSAFGTGPKAEGLVVVGGGDPILVFDNNGTAYLVWISLEANLGNLDSIHAGLYWASSNDGGATWTRPENDEIALGSIDVVTGGGDMYDKEWLAVDRSNTSRRSTIYAAFVHLEGRGGTIEVRRMAPGDGRFTATSVPVSNDSFQLVQFSGIDVDPDGNVHVTFFGTKDSLTGYAMWHARSNDGGLTFTEPNKVADVFLSRFNRGVTPTRVTGIQASRLYPCPQLAADGSSATSRGNLYLTWTAEGLTSRLGHGLDIYFSRSVDNGATWSTPVVVNSDPRGQVRHQFYSSISVSPGGAVAVTWYDRRGDASNNSTHYYIAYSFDGGVSFTPGAPVTSVPTSFSTVGSKNNGFGIGEYTQVLTTSGYAIPVWTDGRTGNGDLNIYSAVVPIGAGAAGLERSGTITDRLTMDEPVVHRDAIDAMFSTSSPGDATIELYDLAGRRAAMLVPSRLEAGRHVLSLPTAGIPQGRYLLRVSAGGATAARAVSVAR